ncbi:hypothetical protein [Georgenia sp. Z1491]|uniref:hypothetical protein n=1 Tax=Georgenia sp. Z1491 TaxID=3416707 RepID=UPI003CF6CF2D
MNAVPTTTAGPSVVPQYAVRTPPRSITPATRPRAAARIARAVRGVLDALLRDDVGARMEADPNYGAAWTEAAGYFLVRTMVR